MESARSEKTLSVITINLNNKEGLQKTIDSVLCQTFSDFEYIVIDGASTDGSAEVVRSVSEKLAYWVSEKDTGIYNAMNKGIKAAKGKYLLFLNSGDFLVKDDVLQLVFDHDIHAGIVCARCNVSQNGVVIWTSNPPDFVTLGTLYSVGLAHQSTFIKRELFERLGYYREDFRYIADVEFWYRSIIFNGASTQKVDVITTDYNMLGISSTEGNSDRYKAELKMILSQEPLGRILPDYDAWRAEKKSLSVLYWVKTKKALYNLLLLLFNIASKISKTKGHKINGSN